MKAVPIGETGKLIGSEWKALTPAEKDVSFAVMVFSTDEPNLSFTQNYQQRYDEEFARYEREYKDAYGHDHVRQPRKANKTS